MGCTEVKLRKYQTRKSPAFHAGDCKGETKAGKDGDYISSPNSRGVYKWIKTRKANSKNKNKNKNKNSANSKSEYIISGGSMHPFKVSVSGKTVTIYKRPPIDFDYPDPKDYTDVFKTFTAENVYPGTAPCDPNMYLATDSCWSGNTGNTVLLHISGNKYMYIGDVIYEFTIDDEFEAYYSVLTSNGMSCPVLLGSRNVYLLGSSIQEYVSRDTFKAPMTPAEWADGEAYYYGFKDIKTGKKTDKNKQMSKTTKIKNIKMIQ
jgi:hypothetical protein